MWQDNKLETNNSALIPYKSNLILDADSYKLSHWALYPAETNAMFSYIEARSHVAEIVPFGLQMWIKKTLLQPITTADVDEAEDIAQLHGEPFNRSDWDYIVSQHGGLLPITIRGLPEGTVTQSLTPIVTVQCDDPRVFWLASYIETSLQRGIWYPTTVASQDRINWQQLTWFYEHGSDNRPMLDFSLHSFGSRGVSSKETAEIGGLAHLVYFKGTDDLVALRAARRYYNCEMAGFSVVATEHSIQCSYGIDDQQKYLNRVLDVYGKSGAIVSVVMDGYDIYRDVDLLCTEYFVNKVKERGCKFVVRPDSGDPFEIIPAILHKLEAAFGYTVNSKGKKVINNIGVIQGDGIDAMSLALLAQKIHSIGYAPECVIYGSGGGLLQKVNRDTFKFAQKTSAIRVGTTWVNTVKDPITDPGKRSKGGVLVNVNFVTFYAPGRGLLVDDSLDVIRARATSC